MNERNLNAAVTLLLALIGQASKISAMIQVARMEKRDLLDEELSQLLVADEAARAALVAAIDAARVPA